MLISYFLALKFLRGSKSEKNISSMIKICFFSILMGTFALTLVSAIMNGFEKATHAKLQGIHADILIKSQDRPLNFEKINTVLTNEFNNLITAASPNGITQAIIQHKNKELQLNNLVAIKAIDPRLEAKVSSLKSMIMNPEVNNSLEELLKDNSIIIGKTVADYLNIKIGDSIKILYAESDESIKKNKLILDSETAIVTSIFKTGIDEFDEHVIFSNLSFFNNISESGVTQINIKLKDQTQESYVIQELKKRLNLSIYSWKDLYPAIVSALALEKYVMLIILTLMTIVASMNIISILFMFITQKQREIVLLKSMGMPDNSIVYIFIVLGICITISASLMGIILATIVSLILKIYPIRLPDAYYVSYLPIEMNWHIVLLVVIITFIISFIASWFPAQRVKSINIIEVLKGDII